MVYKAAIHTASAEILGQHYQPFLQIEISVYPCCETEDDTVLHFLVKFKSLAYVRSKSLPAVIQPRIIINRCFLFCRQRKAHVQQVGQDSLISKANKNGEKNHFLRCTFGVFIWFAVIRKKKQPRKKSSEYSIIYY